MGIAKYAVEQELHACRDMFGLRGARASAPFRDIEVMRNLPPAWQPA